MDWIFMTLGLLVLVVIFMVDVLRARRFTLKSLRERSLQQPNNFQEQYRYALELFYSGQLPHAELQFSRALQLSPEDPACRYYLGTLLLIRGEKDDAVYHLEYAISLSPLFAQAHAALGSAREMKGDLPGAEMSYKKAVKIDSGLADAHFNLARIYAICKDSETSAKHLEQAIKLADVYKHEAKTCTDFDLVCQKPDFQRILYEAA